MTALVRDLGAELEVPVGCVLEGGYNVEALARCVAVTMATLAAGARTESNPVTTRVRSRARSRCTRSPPRR